MADEKVIRQPTLETERLILRPFVPGDAPVVAQLAGRREIADTTISVPHPYPVEQAQTWIKEQPGHFAQGKEVVFAIQLKSSPQLIGAAGLRDISAEHLHAEMGLWVGVPWWRQGYATEASRALLRFGFEDLKLNRIHAHHMVRNPASGRVLARIGLRPEGRLRQCVRKWGVFEDVVLLAILREDWLREEQRGG